MAIPTRQALRAFCKDQYLEKNVIHVHAVMDHFGVSEQVATDLLAALEQEGFLGAVH
jgi:DeoR/GlpR family transcriptional regulator of sugar metabolism